MSDATRLREPLTLLRHSYGPPNDRGVRRDQWAHEYPMLGVLTMGSVASSAGNEEDASGRAAFEPTAIVRGWPILPRLSDEEPLRHPSARDRIRDVDGQVYVIDGHPRREGSRVGRRRQRTVFRLRIATE